MNINRDTLTFLPMLLLGVLVLSCTPKTQDGSLPKTEQQDMPSWQKDTGTFLEHMSKVETGWSRRQLLSHAGEPKLKSEKGWMYQSYVSPVVGGEYMSFWFKIKNNSVVEINKEQRSISTARVPE